LAKKPVSDDEIRRAYEATDTDVAAGRMVGYSDMGFRVRRSWSS